MWSGFRAIFYSLLLSTALTVAGCARAHERQAWVDLREREAVIYQTHELPAPGGDSTLEDYVLYAVTNNPGLKAAFDAWKSAMERVPQAKTPPDPQLTYTYFIRSIETRTGPLIHWFRLSQAYPWFGTLAARGKVALEVARAEQRLYDDARVRLIYQVRDAYYAYYYWYQSLQVVQENLALIKYLEAVARTQFATGRASNADVIRAQVELGRIEDQLRSIQDLQQPVRARLNALLNRPTNEPIPPPTMLTQKAYEFEDARLFALMKDQNPQLAALRARARSQAASIRLAKKQYFPDFVFQAEYIIAGQPILPTPGGGQDPIAVTVSISLPIYYGKYNAAVDEARSNYLSVIHQLHNRENELNYQLQQALYDFRDAGRRIDLYKNALIPKARQSLNVSRQAYEAGKGSFLDLIDAERSLLEFELAYQRALTDRAQSVARIEELIAAPLPIISEKKEGNRK